MNKIYSSLLAVGLGVFSLGAQNAVMNETTGTGYADLLSAWNAAASGDVLVINEAQTVTSRLNSTDRVLTVKAGSANTITRGEGYTALLVLSNSKTSNVTFDGIEFSGADIETGTSFEASSNGTLTLNNVSFDSFKSTNNQGIVVAKNGGAINVTDVAFSSCTVPAGRCEIFAGTDKVTISGNYEGSIYVEKALSFTASDLTNTTPIAIGIDDNRAENTTVVKGWNKAANFTLNSTAYKLMADGDNLINVDINAEEPVYPVLNETTGTGYTSLNAAWDAAASGDVIVLNEAQTVTSRLNSNDRELTVKAGNASTITRGEGYTALLVLSNSKTSNVTFDGIEFSGADIETGTSFEASSNGTLTLNNVSFDSFKSTNNQGIVVAKNGGAINATDVVFSSCTVPEGRGEIFAGTDKVAISGNFEGSIYVEKALSISASDLTNTTPINIYVDSNRNLEEGATIVRGFENPAHFNIMLANTHLEAEDGNLVIKTGTSGVDAIEAENGVAVYYNLQGVEVSNPENGLYIVVRGGKATKEYIR